MTSYTPEQIRQCISWLAGNFRVTADGKYRECADILAATLKAAQGGVTEAINWSEFWNRISQNFDSADVDKVHACYKAAQGGVTEAHRSLLQEARDQIHSLAGGFVRADQLIARIDAALSAQQGQGEALLARVCGMVPGMSRVTLQLPSGPLPEWADLGCTVSVGEPTAPPAQPAERVPEGMVLSRDAEVELRAMELSSLAVQHQLGGWRASHDKAAMTWVVLSPSGDSCEVHERASGPHAEVMRQLAQDLIAASPAPSPARGDGSEG